MIKISRLESLERQLRRDSEVKLKPTEYWQNTLNITEHIERFGNPPISERFAKVRIVR